MRVAVVGAGLAGAAAARTLHDAGVEVVVFEKSRGFGGRAAVKRIGGWTFDSGATSLTPRGMAIESALADHLSPEEVVWIDKPIYTHSSGKIRPGDPSRNHRRCCFRSGMNALSKAMLQNGIEVRLQTRIEKLELPGDGGVVVDGAWFDAAVLTCPAPQTLDLLKTVGHNRGLDRSVYRRTLSIMLAWETEFDAPWHALIDPDQDEPLTWMCVETIKAPGARGPVGSTAVVAQMSRAYSRDHWESEESKIIRDAQTYCERLIGKDMGLPAAASLHRWKFAQPEAVIQFETANPMGTRLIVAGDALGGPRMELAFESGLEAARRLIS